MRQYFNISSENNNLNLDLTKFKRLVIYDWSVPFTFFNIYGYNNRVIDSTGSGLLLLPFGNYDVNTLKTYLEAELPISGFQITFNTTIYKTTISATNTFNLGYNPFLEMLGFTNTQTLTGSNTYTSANVYNLNKFVNNVYIKSNNLYNVLDYKPLSKNNQLEGFIKNVNTGNFSYGNIITNFNSYITVLPLHENSNYIPSLTCELSDYYGNKLNTQGQEIILFCYVE
jgi:hypothetical protein